MEIREALSYDDVLLVPKHSPVKSRRDVSTETMLSNNIKMQIPIVSSNMDTVTEHKTAISMAALGGIGIIHRFLTIEDQVIEVLKVKRSQGFRIDQPYTIEPSLTLGQAKRVMFEKGVNGMVVTDKHNYLRGLLTKRDIQFEDDESSKISELMTPNERLITAGEDCSMEEAERIFKKYKVEKIPLIDKNGILQGLITSKDLLKRQQHPLATKDSKGRLRVGAAVGVKKGYMQRSAALVDAGADALVVDIAHGHSDLAMDTVKDLKGSFPDVDIIAGNVATADGVNDLCNAGVDSVKIGVGPGSICITRLVAGAGVPQFSAVVECAKAAKEFGIPIIADGGCKTSGDIAKAIAAGAQTVMLGSMLAGTREAPGMTITKNGRRYKISRGMASFGAALGRKEREKSKDSTDDFVPEGVEAMVPYRGKVSGIIRQMVGGLRSGISYCGARNIIEMQQNASFVKITTAGMKESKPHDVETV